MDWSELRLSAATSYRGRPAASGDGVEISTAFHSTWFVSAGWAEVRHGDRCWRAGPGTGLVLPVNWLRFQGFSPDARIVSLGLQVTWPDGQPLLDLDAPIHLTDPAVMELAIQAVALQAADGAAWLRARSALYAFAGSWLEQLLAAGARIRSAGSGDTRLDRACRLLCEHPDLGPLPYAQLRTATGLSRTQLDRCFRQTLGCSPRQLRDRAALREARGLLADPGRKLATIVRELGATDASHLVKWFRRQTGRTPGEERRLGPGA